MTPKEKARWARIKRVYGLTENDYANLDRGHCPLCMRNWTSTTRPCVDHDHSTGFVRGLLCSYCNRYVLGRLRDVTVARRIVSYLAKQPLKHKVPKAPVKRRKRKKKI